ncbi:MAG: alpha/beta fold hydrolase [Bacteroidia bacterium]
MIQQFFIFRQKKLKRDFQFQFSVPHEEFFLSPEAEVEINGLWFHHEAPRGLIIYFHGNADNLARWGQYSVDFLACGYEIAMIDYRTFGKSTGKLSEEAFYDDARAFYDYAMARHPGGKTIIYGRSLGSAIATQLASVVKTDQLILETPFFNMPELIAHYLPLISDKVSWSFNFPSHEYIKEVNVPITIFHGTEDEIVPYEEGRKFVALLGEKVAFITIEGGKHKNLRDFPLFHTELERVLNQ